MPVSSSATRHYHYAENGFCVLRAKARGHRDIVTVVGHAAIIAAGEWITATGEWVNDRTHGQQFKARFLRTSPPTSADGIEKYLSSGMIRASARPMASARCGRLALSPHFPPHQNGYACRQLPVGFAPLRAVRAVLRLAHSVGRPASSLRRSQFDFRYSNRVKLCIDDDERTARALTGIVRKRQPMQLGAGRWRSQGCSTGICSRDRRRQPVILILPKSTHF